MERTKGQLEDALSKSILQFEKDYIGRGPQAIRTYIVEDLIVVRLRDALTVAEQKLIESPDGANLVKQMREKLLEESRLLLNQIVHQITGAKVVSMVSSVDIERAERILLFTLDVNLSRKLGGSR
ncbi:MAG: hypothetical protein BAA04_00225 [Firmicutes bacterium ZCTH02-B6]|nr:MAG: hypothetical protein BAA04_00225 [Firmicutes bacterium ZCTH02-B6]